MTRLDDVRSVRWFDGWLEIGDANGTVLRVAVAARDLALLGFTVKSHLRYLAARFPAGSTAVLEQHGRRMTLAITTEKAG